MTQARGSYAYTLDLPSSLSKLHLVFNVSKLKAYQGSIPAVPDPIELDDSFEYKVEALFYQKFVSHGNKCIQYLVAFVGYDLLFNE